jgi:hypothetical protein
MATMAIDQDATQTHFAHLADLSGRRQSVWGGACRDQSGVARTLQIIDP